MMAKGHFLSGLTAGLLSCPLTAALAPGGVESPARALTLSAAWTALVGVGSLWPDIDHKPAFISKCIPGVSQLLCWIFRHASMVIYQATRTDKDRKTGCHRTFTHTAVFAILTGSGIAALLLFTPAHAWAGFVGASLGLGTAVHDMPGDGCTESGVPFWWPLKINGKRWASVWFLPKALRFRAGGPVGERIATLVFTGLAAGLAGLVLLAGGSPWWSPVLTLMGGL